MVCDDHTAVPLLTSAVHRPAGALTLSTATAPVGVVAESQCAPVVVVTTTPLDEPFDPTARQSALVGQATPLSSGV